MTRMLPPKVWSQTPSHAERKMFDLIKSGLGADWIALHSLGISSPSGKPWTELDFVLIGPPGIFCLEVKGGRVTRSNGVWGFTDHLGHTDERPKGPWDQAAAGSTALRNFLVVTDRRFENIAVGHGVMMPDIWFEAEGPDVEPAVLYDERHIAQSFSQYVRRLIDYWHAKLERMRNSPVEYLSETDRGEIVSLLRRDFDYRPSLRMQVGWVKDELIRLTDEQYRVLERLASNARVAVSGGAGTGKTVLAVEEARRWAESGKSVLLCCYNKRLAEFLRQVVADEPRILVHHLHGLMHDTVKEAGLLDSLPDAEPEDKFAIFYPEAFLDALVVLDRLEPYDVLIVDEAQDLLLNTYLSAFDALVRGGLSNGKWRLFIDPYQNLFEGSDFKWASLLSKGSPTHYRLTVNCRNTAPIGIEVAILSGTPTAATLTTDGPEVEHHWCRDSSHQRREISKRVSQLLSSGLRPSQIVVLSPCTLDNSCLRNGFVNTPVTLVPFRTSSKPHERQEIGFSTIQAFKGLEADAVLLADVDDLATDKASSLFYVGGSRAHAFLAMFASESANESYKHRAYEFGRRLAAEGRSGDERHDFWLSGSTRE